jgi:hypothetical protein
MTMGTTPSRGYPFPDDLDEADVPEDLAKLAAAVDADVSSLTYDSGWIDVAPVNDFTVDYEGARYRRKANVTFLQIMVKRPATWPSEIIVFRLPVGFRPKYNNWVLANNQGKTIEVRVMSNGEVRFVTDGAGVVVFSAALPID